MKFQILISTVDSHYQERGLSLSVPHLIIDQIVGAGTPRPTAEHLFEYTERGLARSRNHALDHATGEICLLSDDDLQYEKDIEKIVTDAFEKNPAADIITFQIETSDGKPFSSYKNESFWHNKRTIMRVASVEIAFKRSSIKKSHLRFDEHFGLGVEFPTGEENIFLSDALDRGLKLLYIPVPIVIHPPESSGENYDNTKLVQAKGAMFVRIFGLKGYAISLLFALKKYKFSRHTLFRFYKLMLQGAKNYRDLKNR